MHRLSAQQQHACVDALRPGVGRGVDCCASRCERVGEGAHTLSTSCSSARHIIMRCERAGRRALIRVDTMERRSCGAS
jgi:hypothetical protein